MPFLILLNILLTLIDISYEYSYKLNLMSPSSKAPNIWLIIGPLTHIMTSKQSVFFFLDFGEQECFILTFRFRTTKVLPLSVFPFQDSMTQT